MNAPQVLAALRKRWPDSEFLTIEEAPEASDRSGRKIDLLAVSLWRSRGLEVDAVEVKVSASDWKRELDRGGKADFWWRHSHRFWLAVPTELAGRVREDLPAGWGLLACDGDGSKIIVKPERRAAEPMQWGTCVGLMRAAAGAGVNALMRAEQKGRQEGREAGKAEALRRAPDSVAAQHLTELRERVARFEAASGLDITRAYSIENLGAQVALVNREMSTPGWTAERLGSAAQSAVHAAEYLLKEARTALAEAKGVSAALTSAPVLLTAGD